MKTFLIIIHLMLLSGILWLNFPYHSSVALDLSKKLAKSQIPFLSASSFFYRSAIANDKELSSLLKGIDAAIAEKHFDAATQKLGQILQRYSQYSDAENIRIKISSAQKDFIKQKTAETKEAWQNNHRDQACAVAPLADQTDPQISMIMGFAYLAKKNFNDAEKKFLYAAQNGVVTAAMELAKMYEAGKIHGFSQETDAEKWYRFAMDHGNTEAMAKLGILLSKMYRHEEAVKLLSKAVDHGNPMAEKCLAQLYYRGDGVEKDIKKAVQLFESVAEKDDAEAMLSLGMIYNIQESSLYDKKKAAEWFGKAASKGNPRAQYELARMYENGIGLEKNFKKAETLYRKSAENGNEKAKAWVTQYEEQCRQLAEAEKRKKENISKAISAFEQKKYREAFSLANDADLNNPRIQAILAQAYYFGNGTEKDGEKAFSYAQKSASAGNSGGYYILARVYEDLQKIIRNKYNTREAVDKDFGNLEKYHDFLDKCHILTCRNYLKAAEGGIVHAQYKVGELCLFGAGFDDGVTKLKDVKKNLFRPGRYCNISPDNGETTKIHDYAKAKYWLEKAMAAGSVDAAALLAGAYIGGRYSEYSPEHGFSCDSVGCIPRDTAKAREIIEWIRRRDPKRAEAMTKWL